MPRSSPPDGNSVPHRRSGAVGPGMLVVTAVVLSNAMRIIRSWRACRELPDSRNRS
jgi:hypothetical protein